MTNWTNATKKGGSEWGLSRCVGGCPKKETRPRSRLRGRVVDLARQKLRLAQLAHYLVYGVFAQGRYVPEPMHSDGWDYHA